MANLVVTSTTNTIRFVYNDYATPFGWSKRTRLKISLSVITLHPNFIEYIVNDGTKYYLHYTTNIYGGLIVDSIDGVAPSSLSDLYDKMIAVVA